MVVTILLNKNASGATETRTERVVSLVLCIRRMLAGKLLRECVSAVGFLDPNNILHGLLSGSSDTRQARLRSRRPFVPAARNLLENLVRLGIRASEWKNHKWKTEYCENASRLRAFVPWTGARPIGMGLPQAVWFKLDRLRISVG